jgi:hypothetical protein
VGLSHPIAAAFFSKTEKCAGSGKFSGRTLLHQDEGG